MFDKKPQISVSSQPKDFEYWINRPYISYARREKLRQATLLIVPYEGVENSHGPLFSAATKDLLEIFNDRHPSLVADVAIEEDAYAELVLHGKLLDLGKVVTLAALIPISMNLVSNYIQRMMDGDGRDTVRFELTIAGADGTSKSIKYDGPASTFEKMFADTLAKIGDRAGQPTVAKFQLTQSSARASSDHVTGAESKVPRPLPSESHLNFEAIQDSKKIKIPGKRKHGKKRNR